MGYDFRSVPGVCRTGNSAARNRLVLRPVRPLSAPREPRVVDRPLPLRRRL
ncbi:hypothetical protein BZL29_3164 [Mycobacterium kansasii]|uniref:Uncharacterized protein n=1 Tax=Mycobacterium kansasii TaxID=1768 RepID=A0A1V3XEZ0_MYCKA|nr:hypothetical protein BZL29_3164 [Mycobacterium kansasii]